MSKTILLIAFIGMCLFQLFMPARTIWQMETVVEEGTTYYFRCAPVDPNDPFRGKYLTLNFKDVYVPIDTTEEWTYDSPIFVELYTNENGIALPKKGHLNSPISVDYIPAEISRLMGDYAVINYSFNRFYIEEDEAKLAEDIYRKATRENKVETLAEVKVLDGKAVLEDILIDGQSIRELVKLEQ